MTLTTCKVHMGETKTCQETAVIHGDCYEHYRLRSKVVSSRDMRNQMQDVINADVLMRMTVRILMLPFRLFWYWLNRHWYNGVVKMPMWLSFIISSVPIYSWWTEQSALLPIAYLIIMYTYSREYTWERFQSGEYPLFGGTPQPIEGDKPKRKEKRKHENVAYKSSFFPRPIPKIHDTVVSIRGSHDPLRMLAEIDNMIANEDNGIYALELQVLRIDILRYIEYEMKPAHIIRPKPNESSRETISELPDRQPHKTPHTRG